MSHEGVSLLPWLSSVGKILFYCSRERPNALKSSGKYRIGPLESESTVAFTQFERRTENRAYKN